MRIRRHGEYLWRDFWVALAVRVLGLDVDRWGVVSVFSKTLYANDPSRWLVAHERIHLEQYARDGWRFPLRYLLCPAWRVLYEAEAYLEGSKLSALGTAGWIEEHYLLPSWWSYGRVLQVVNDYLTVPPEWDGDFRDGG